MKSNVFSFLLALVALGAPMFPPQAEAVVEVSFDYFQNELSSYGQWIEVGNYGACWRPTSVGADWAPYTDGYWAYTDGGWTWASYEDWGGITYHYGRWLYVEDEGWVWVPGYEWAPAWVSWRTSDDYVGWAPLPPEAHFEVSVGFGSWIDDSCDIGPSYYRFCHVRDFGAPVLAPVCFPPERNITIIEQTVNVTNITYYHDANVVFCGGPNYVTINRHVHRPIPALKLVRDPQVLTQGRHRPPQLVRGNQLAVFAPKVEKPADPKALPVKPAKVIPAGRVDRGWAKVSDPQVRQQIKQKLQADAKGKTPQTAPARPVAPADVAAVPKQADPNAVSPALVGKVKEPRAKPAREDVVAPNQLPPVKAGEPPRIENKPGQAAGEPGLGRPQVSPKPSIQTTPALPDKPGKVEQPARPGEKKARPQIPERAVQLPAPSATDEAARAAEREQRRQEREAAAAAAERQQHRQAEVAREPQRQAEAAQRAKELRREQAGQQQQQEAAQRANEARREQAQQRQAQQQAAERAAEVRRQQQQQQQQQHQAAAERSMELRRAHAQEAQREAAQRTEALRRQQAQQQMHESAQRARQAEQIRHSQQQQRQYTPPPQQPQQQQSSSGKEGKQKASEGEKKQRGR
jgi:hypothetical protein